jgi:hypothetical protein
VPARARARGLSAATARVGSRDSISALDTAAQLVLLAQIDSDARTSMGWGDAGRLYWLIGRDDLAAGRFDKAAFTWQCEWRARTRPSCAPPPG